MGCEWSDADEWGGWGWVGEGKHRCTDVGWMLAGFWCCSTGFVVMLVYGDGCEWCNGEAELCEDLLVALCGVWQGGVCESVSDDGFFVFSSFVDYCHLCSCHSESCAQVFASQHVVEVGYGIVVACLDCAEEAFETGYAFILVEVDADDRHVGWHPCE